MVLVALLETVVVLQDDEAQVVNYEDFLGMALAYVV